MMEDTVKNASVMALTEQGGHGHHRLHPAPKSSPERSLGITEGN